MLLLKAPRSIQELTRCLSDAARVEDEVWERMQLLTSSLRAMRRCIDECSVAHGQVGAGRGGGGMNPLFVRGEGDIGNKKLKRQCSSNFRP